MLVFRELDEGEPGWLEASNKRCLPWNRLWHPVVRSGGHATDGKNPWGIGKSVDNRGNEFIPGKGMKFCCGTGGLLLHDKTKNNIFSNPWRKFQIKKVKWWLDYF